MSDLPRFRSVMRRLFPGREPKVAAFRQIVGKVAEYQARRAGATANTVLDRVVRARSAVFTAQQKLELRLALERDLGGEP